MSQKDFVPSAVIKAHTERCGAVIKEVGIGEPNFINDTINVIGFCAPLVFQKNGMNGMISEFELADKTNKQ